MKTKTKGESLHPKDEAIAEASAEEIQRRMDAIATHAYALWEAAGQPANRDEEFWRQAEQELDELGRR